MSCNYIIIENENDLLLEEYFYNGHYDPKNTLMLFYDHIKKRFFEINATDGIYLDKPIHNIYEILEPWKVMLFLKNKSCDNQIFPDRTNSFLVELTWAPF